MRLNELATKIEAATLGVRLIPSLSVALLWTGDNSLTDHVY